MNIEGLLNDENLPAVPEDLPKWDGSSITTPKVGVFDGTLDAMADILPNAALMTGSAATSVISQAGIESAAIEAQEIGVPIEDPTTFAKEQAERTAAVAKEWRRKAKEDYSPDPETTGVVAQVIHGVGTEITKGVMATLVTGGNAGAASLLYGAQHGIETAQRYKDQGVDENTAASLGVGAFVAGTLGMRLPAALGSTRAVSALYGSVVNPLANVSEDATIRTILDKAGYAALADKVDPFDPVNLAVAAVVGGGFGALGYRARPDTELQEAVAKADAADNAKAAAEAPAVDAKQKPVSEAVSKALNNSIVNANVDAIREASALRVSSAGVVLQNRDRNTAKSIMQMQRIAVNPVYTMVSVSRDFAQGAPAIGYAEIPEAQYGRYERVAASDGTMMEMRYAVIEADQVQTSNFVDGSRNPDYGTEARNIAIAGNGRIAGIAEAYRRGTADKYKADLVADADTVGIPKEVIEKMQAPVLVRVMSDKDAGRADTAALSNETGTAGFDAAEQAENDAAAIDLAQLTFDEEGNITSETIQQFAALVKDPSMIVDKAGRPNVFARPRLERAIFQRVFGDANLTSMLTDEGSSGKRVVQILMRAAPKLMQLEGSPLDFRDDLKAAVNAITTAKASGQFSSIDEVARQIEKGRTPETTAFLDYFATVGGVKINEPAKVFSDLADWVTANRESQTGLFADETPEATRVDLMMQFSQMTGVPVDPKLLDMIQQEVTHSQKVQQVHKTIADQLRASGQPEEQIEAQATLWTNATMRLAEQAHVDPMEILPRIKVSEEVPVGSLNQIIGIEGAENLRESGADIDYIAVAESMRAQGKTPQEIRLATGWEQGADGKWRYEIPDFKFKDGWDSAVRDARSRLDSEYAKRQENVSDDSEFLALEEQLAAEKRNLIVSRNLSEIVDAPELFSAYPQLKDLTVEFGPLPDRVGGYFSEDRNVIRLPLDSAISSKQARSTLVHEVQHAVQRIEGFTRGSNPEAFPLKSFALWRDMERLRELRRSDAWKEYKQKNDAIDPFEASDEQWAEITALENNPDVAAVLAEVERLRNKWGFSETVVRAINSDEWDPFSSTGRELDDSDPDYRVRQYRNVAGEVEARNVQSRLDLSDEERRTRLLAETEDVPRDEQSVKIYQGENLSVTEQTEFERTIREWVSEETLSRARGKTREQIYEMFDNDLRPIAFIPQRFLSSIFANPVADNRVYTSEAYFVDHAVNHHGSDVAPSDYFRIQEMLSEPDEVILDRRDGKDAAIFTKQLGKKFLIVVRVDNGPNGRLQFYKSLHTTSRKKPYPKLDRAVLPVDAPSSRGAVLSQYIRTSDEAHGGRRFSALDNVNSIANRAQNVNNLSDQQGEFHQTAWHGSPHQFDRFSTEHIGSGEGAQMHGWGLYFAEDQAVADRYRGSLVIGRGENEYSISYKGARPEELPPSLRVGLERLKGNVLHIDSDIRREYESLVYSLNERFEAADRIAKVYEGLIAQIDENPKQSISSFLARVPEDEKYRADLAVKSARAAAKNEGRRASVNDVRTQLNDSLAAVDQQRRENKEPLDALRQIDPDDLTVEYDSGRVFKVDIPDSDKMLDEQKLWGAGSNFELKAKIRGMISEWNGDHLDTEQMIYVPDRPTGRDVYQAISKAMGGPKQASLWLKERGIEGITYVGGTDGRCYVVFDDQAIEVLDFYQRQSGEALGSYSPAENRITLTPNANITTFSHEMGHFWLANAIEFSKSNRTDISLRQDVRKLFDIWGIKDQAYWDDLGVEGQRKYHEQFASWVEEYLSTGKVPAPTLQSLFEKFRTWITSLYRDMRAHLEGRYRSEFGEELPPLSKEVRDILDRNLAYEDAMRAARSDFSVTHAQADSARYANFERIKRQDQMTDQSDEQQTQASLSEEFKAADAINSGQKVEVSAPVDVDRMAGQKRIVEERLGFPETIAPKVQPEGMPVYETPQIQGLDQVPLELPSGSSPEEVAAAREGAEIVKESPNMAVVTADGESRTALQFMQETEQQAREVEAFSETLNKAAQCIVNNGGI